MHRLIPAFLLLTLLAGCPSLTLKDVRIKDSGVTGTTFTIAATVVVEKVAGEGDTDPAATDDGRGVVAIYVPEGWRVKTVSARHQGETPLRALTPAPQAAVGYSESFPAVPGQFWAFASMEQKIGFGSWEYPMEIEIETPKKAKSAQIGIAVGPFQDKPDNPAPPQEFRVELKGKKATIQPVGAAPAAAAQPTQDGGEKTSAW